MAFKKITEAPSLYNDLEKMDVAQLLDVINTEDQKVALAVKTQLPQIEKVAVIAGNTLKASGRIFYLGAGTSGRLGILDASECPPTFGVSHDKVIGLIAGGDTAIRKAVEFAEDDFQLGWKDLQNYNINEKDFVIGIAASGTTPYVLGALECCQKHQIKTASITCNPNSPLSNITPNSIVINVGPEVLTGSSRMKAGTAQKMVLNMISTTAMIQYGKVEGNRMVDMQLSNTKLINRGCAMLMDTLNISNKEARELLEKHKSVRQAINAYNTNT